MYLYLIKRIFDKVFKNFTYFKRYSTTNGKTKVFYDIITKVKNDRTILVTLVLYSLGNSQCLK